MLDAIDDFVLDTGLSEPLMTMYGSPSDQRTLSQILDDIQEYSTRCGLAAEACRALAASDPGAPDFKSQVKSQIRDASTRWFEEALLGPNSWRNTEAVSSIDMAIWSNAIDGASNVFYESLIPLAALVWSIHELPDFDDGLNHCVWNGAIEIMLDRHGDRAEALGVSPAAYRAWRREVAAAKKA